MQSAGRSSQLQTRERNEGSGRDGRELKTWLSQHASANDGQARSVKLGSPQSTSACEPLMHVRTVLSAQRTAAYESLPTVAQRNKIGITMTHASPNHDWHIPTYSDNLAANKYGETRIGR